MGKDGEKMHDKYTVETGKRSLVPTRDTRVRSSGVMGELMRRLDPGNVIGVMSGSADSDVVGEVVSVRDAEVDGDSVVDVMIETRDTGERARLSWNEGDVRLGWPPTVPDEEEVVSWIGVIPGEA